MAGHEHVILINNGNNLYIFNDLKQKLPTGFTIRGPDYSEPIKSGPDNNIIFSITCTIHLTHELNEIKIDEIEIREQGKGRTKQDTKNDCHGPVNEKIMEFVAKNSSANFQISNPIAIPKRKKEKNSTKSYFTKPKNGGYLGKGSYGKVFCVVKKGKEKELLALKIPIDEERDEDGIDDEEEIEKFDAELRLHQKAQENEFVVKIFEAVSLRNRRAFVMEYCSRGTLADLTKREPNIAPSLMFRIHKEIADALNYLHGDDTYKSRIAHNDLKPSNVLLTETFSARLADFGGSTMATRTTKRTDQSRTGESKIGTDHFLSPERANKENGFSEKLSDVYSFGVCLHASLCTPDKDLEPFRTHYKNKERTTTAEIRNRIHELEMSGDIVDADILYEMFKMVRYCCRQDPKHRPTAEQVYYTTQSYYKENNLGEKALKAQDGLKKKYPLKNFTYDGTWVDVEEVEL